MATSPVDVVKRPLVLERAEGWPESLGRALVLLATAGLLATWLLVEPAKIKGQLDFKAYLVCVFILLLGASLVLSLWRRGVTLHHATGMLTRWWGLALGARTLVLRVTEKRPLQGFEGIRIMRAGEGDHYKHWRQGTYRVQLEKSESVGGQWSLRERLIIDDEFATREEAVATGRAVSDYLGLEMVEPTSPA